MRASEAGRRACQVFLCRLSSRYISPCFPPPLFYFVGWLDRLGHCNLLIAISYFLRSHLVIGLGSKSTSVYPFHFLQYPPFELLHKIWMFSCPSPSVCLTVIHSTIWRPQGIALT